MTTPTPKQPEGLMAADYQIPAEALANHIALLGKTGSGKSNAAKTVAEAKLAAGERVCVLDPTGAWFGLRLNKDGSPSPYPVVIFGGMHGDIPITGAHGGAIAEIVGTSSTPAVIDTRMMTVGDRTRFFTDFAEALLRKNRGPLTLIIDEAHLFAPQGRVADPQSGKMLHAANNLVSLGRSIGLRVIMLSQRPAKLHKDSLTQVETLIAMRLIAPQDRAAIDAWIGEWADLAQGKEIVTSLPSLPTGAAWVWSPEIGVLERVQFPLANTFDSGKAPAEGDRGPELAPIDLDEVTGRLEQVAADVVANDPKALKAEIAKLKRELAAKPGGAPDEAAIAEAEQRGYERGVADEAPRAEARGIAVGLARARAALDAIRVDDPPPAAPRPLVTPQRAHLIEAKAERRAAPVASGEVPPGCAKPLAVLAGVYPAGMTEAQWATAAGLKRTGGTWSTYKSRLRGAAMIEARDGRWFATEAGAFAVGDVETPPPPGPELVRWWAAKLPGVSRMADVLIDAGAHGLDRETLAARLDLTASGGTFSTYLSRLAGPGLIERDGGVIRLSPEVFP